jgi:hypothetical protein
MKKTQSALKIIKDKIDETQKFLDINRESLEFVSTMVVKTEEEILERDKLILMLNREYEDMKKSLINLKANYSEALDKINID